MSSQPTLSPEQIAYIEKMISRISRETLVSVLESGLIMTEKAMDQMNGDAPAFKPASEHPTAPPTQPKPESALPFNPELCNWQLPEGKDYRMAKDGQNFKLLVDWLGEHNGKTTVNGKFMWLFTRKDAIGWKL
jgi:hypothetical protein